MSPSRILPVLLLAACTRGPTRPAVRSVPCRVDPALTEDGVREGCHGTEWESRARWVSRDRLEIVSETDGRPRFEGTHITRVRAWVDFRPPEPPEVDMSSVVVGRGSSDWTPHLDLWGEVRASSDGSALGSDGAAPFLMSFHLDGPCAGSNVRRDGYVVLTSADFENRRPAQEDGK